MSKEKPPHVRRTDVDHQFMSMLYELGVTTAELEMLLTSRQHMRFAATDIQVYASAVQGQKNETQAA
jgi:hypothetical protein